MVFGVTQSTSISSYMSITSRTINKYINIINTYYFINYILCYWIQEYYICFELWYKWKGLLRTFKKSTPHRLGPFWTSNV